MDIVTSVKCAFAAFVDVEMEQGDFHALWYGLKNSDFDSIFSATIYFYSFQAYELIYLLLLLNFCACVFMSMLFSLWK